MVSFKLYKIKIGSICQLQTSKLRQRGDLEEVFRHLKAHMTLLSLLFLTCSRKCFRVT